MSNVHCDSHQQLSVLVDIIALVKYVSASCKDATAKVERKRKATPYRS